MRRLNLFRRSSRANKIEQKGYYADRSNQKNEFFRQLFGALNVSSALQSWSFTEGREALFRLFADKDSGNSTVYSVVSGIASAAADVIQFAELYDRKGEVITDHWCQRLLSCPNDATSQSEFTQLYMVNLLVVGDTFIYGQEAAARLNGEKFSSMYVMPSHMVEIQSGGLLAPIKGYRLTSSLMFDARAPKLNPGNVLFAKLPNPAGDTFHGLSPLVTALKKIEIMESGDRRINTMFKNGGVVNLVYPTSQDSIGLTTQQIERFEELANDGIGNKTKFMNTPVGSVRLGDTPADLSILSTSEYATQAICNVYGYPLDLLYARSTYSNMNEAKKMRYLIAIPYVNAFLEKYAQWTGVSRDGMRLAVNTDKIEVLKPDPNQIISAMVNAGTTINERREYLGYERLSDPIYDQVTYSMGTAFGSMDEDLNRPLPEIEDNSHAENEAETETTEKRPESND